MSVHNQFELRPHVGETAPEANILTLETGAEVSLAHYWQTGPAVLVFLRHFG